MTDQLSPEDRALYDAFFRSYGLKYAELQAAAGDGVEPSLDACTVHAIKVMVESEIDRRHAEAIARIERELDLRILDLPTEEPRIVSAVGVGVKVRPPEETAPVCELCGEPMPEGETMFKFHGYSGPCPKPAEGGE